VPGNAFQYKYLHSQSGEPFMQKIDYTYNIRGWLTGINNPALNSDDGDQFGMQLFYNTQPDWSVSGSQHPSYNGNISEIKWGVTNKTNLLYLYGYDGANRLTAGCFSGPGHSSESFWTAYEYDKNGNFTSLQRFADEKNLVDKITFGYLGSSSNQLKYAMDNQGDYPGVEDFEGVIDNTAQHYFYDGNGNLTRDEYQSLSLIGRDY
jgi:hypothetical protein